MGPAPCLERPEACLADGLSNASCLIGRIATIVMGVSDVMGCEAGSIVGFASVTQAPEMQAIILLVSRAVEMG